MITKLHSLFLWSALAIFVCVGFSGTVVANETTECRLASYIDLSQFPLSSQAKLRKILPSTITEYPKNIRDLDPRLYVDWRPRGNTWIADVEIGKLIVRYKCDGPAGSLGRSRASASSDNKKPRLIEAKSQSIITCKRNALPRWFQPERFPKVLTSKQYWSPYPSPSKVTEDRIWFQNSRGETFRYKCDGPAWEMLFGWLSDENVCKRKSDRRYIESSLYADEAKRRNLNCDEGGAASAVNVASKSTNQKASKYAAAPDYVICLAIQKNWTGRNGYIAEAKNRDLSCDQDEAASEVNVASKSTNESDIASSTNNQSGLVAGAAKKLKSSSDQKVCSLATWLNTSDGIVWRGSAWSRYVDEAKRRGLSCGVGEAATEKIASNGSSSAAPTSVAPSTSSISPQTPSASASKPPPVEDSRPPTISIASNTANGPQAKIEGRVFDEAGIAEVIIDGEVVGLGSDGSFTASFYVPRSGKTVEIVAFDSKGNKATKSLVLERGQMRNTTGPSFASLNPSGKRVKPNQDALALIIGVADYERTPARAAYADKDAQTFYDYAMLKLGIPASNIKELVNADANEAEVRLAVKDWIARSTKQGQSDVYVFFAGHGLANQSGDDMYLLPVDGEPRLLSDTAIARERLFADIAAANPRSVTVFLDTCYSGTTRGTDMLIASRPIAIRAKEQSIPEGFIVMTAAAGDQTAKPLEEAKHGMFSYFLMKGMEGDADTNQDNQITAGELHTYVQQNVIQQSSGSQTPELQGDANRVLVRFQ